MVLTQSSAHSMSEFMKRLAVTLGALAIYRLGSHLPLAGIAPEPFAELSGSSPWVHATERISIFALGIAPIISVLLLVEVARLLSGRFNDWTNAAPNNIRLLQRYVLIGALLLAGAQGIGMANALEAAAGHLVIHPGPQFRIGVMVTCVASTALLVWLAAVISRHGIGNGLWVLLVTPHLASLPGLAWSWFDAVQSGILSANSFLAACIYPVVAVAIVATLARPLTRSDMPLDRALIWPLFIAAWLGSILLSIPPLIPSGYTQTMAMSLLHPGAPLYLVALAAFTILVSLAQWRRRSGQAGRNISHAEAADELPIALTALSLAALAAIPEILTAYLDMPILIDARFLAAMVVIALPIQTLLQRRPA